MTNIKLLQEQAAQIINTPDWRVYRVECVEPNGFLLTGAVTPLYTRGKRKGTPNWQKRDKRTERRVAVSRAEHTAFCEAWEKDNGLCSQCHGSKTIVRGWVKDHGYTYVPCPRCQPKAGS